ncbi:MAG: dipeptidase [Solirubrobacterales bacterium]
MIVDLHSHYPIHLIPGEEADTVRAMSRSRGASRFGDRVRAFIVRLASRFANYPSFDSGPRVTMEKLRAGDVGVALSVLYSPFDEIDLDEGYPSAPDDDYFPRLLRRLGDVEADIHDNHDDVATIAHNPAEIDQAVEAGKTALVHCVEGGFHLGEDEEAVARNTAELSRRGVAYITVAHLIWREVATNANAIPFLPQWLYDRLFPQPDVGLAPLGRALVEAMVENGLLVDLSHMSRRALEDTLALLDELDHAGRVPVIASHSAFRFGEQAYNLDEPTIVRIARRGGVIGLILAEHQIADGLETGRRRKGRATHSLAASIELLCRHIDRIREITGSYDHVAVSSDLDGFIKPTLAGLQDAEQLGSLEPAFAERHGAEAGEAITSANALRVLRAGWGGT